MVRPLRDRDPSRFVLATIRTQGALLWLIPSRTLNAVIGGVLARYQEETGVEIYAYCVLSNHIHLIVRDQSGNLDFFFENVNREVARRVNKMHGRIASFWGRRYDAQVIITEDDLLEAFLYVTTNAVRHGLVERTKEWPGLCSLAHSCDEKDLSFKFTHYSLKDENGQFVQTTHKLKLSRIPNFQSLSIFEYRTRLRKLIRQRENKIYEERIAAGKGFLGVKQILRQVAGSLSRETARSKRPLCYSKSKEARATYRKERRWASEVYQIASRWFRAGDYSIKFPEWCYKPPLHKVPIVGNRKILNEKYNFSREAFVY